ncbi:MAG TPA: FAD-linked oxidase C-terminal domain-containing protein [Planctomycetota bacterium]|nr:FAD-linked oxidase C-terminal domain-containing protein [Planctomycetota bacterium]
MDPAVASELRQITGEAGVVDDPALLFPYESDGLAMIQHRPELVVLPRDTDQAARCMRVLARRGVPVVSRGAGTGLSGGATPVAGGALVGTARMRDVLEVRPEERWARVQAGVANVDLTAAVRRHGLFYAPDPSSQQACTIGGNVGENSGGPHCFRYGATSRHVLGLVVVLASGEVLDLSRPEVDPQGYDLVGLFVGSEGLLGLATEVTIALLPRPAAIETLLAVFPSLEGACDSVSDVIAARLEPSALEILDRLTIEAVERSVFAAGYPRGAEAVLLVDIEGSQAEVAANVPEILAILGRRGAIEVRSATDEAERRRLWAGRKGAFGAMGRIAPDLYVADVVVPRTRLREVVLRSTEIAREKGLRLATVFHAGDGNLHPNICYDRRDPDEVRRVLEAGAEMMRLCIEVGGSLTGEHGVGLEKLEAMELLFTGDDLRAMCAAREAWDPDLRMNPGKLLPVRACRETRQALAATAAWRP